MKSQGRIGGETQLNKPQSSHIFSLSCLNPDSKNKFDIELDFSCCSMEAQSVGDNNVDTTSNMSNVPVFNFDGNASTPAFIYKREKSLFQQNIHNSNQSLLPHTQKNIEQIQHIMIPKPKSQYCSVCKTHFPDYLNHIKRQDHIQKLRWSNKKNKIDDLVSYFHKNKKRNENRKSSFHETQVLERKKKVRIIDEHSIYSPVAIISKNVSESPTNNSSMQKQNFKKFHSERILQY